MTHAVRNFKTIEDEVLYLREQNKGNAEWATEMSRKYENLGDGISEKSCHYMELWDRSVMLWLRADYGSELSRKARDKAEFFRGKYEAYRELEKEFLPF